MAIKQFSTGEVLTAADTNLYLANSGFVTIAGNTFTAAATIDITGWSSTYKFYRLIYRTRRTDASGNSTATFQILQGASAESGYYYGSAYANYLGVTGNLANGNGAVNAFWAPSDSYAADSMIACDIVYRQASSFSWTGTGWYMGAAYNFHYGGGVSTTKTIDKMRITYATGTHTGEWILMAQRTYS